MLVAMRRPHRRLVAGLGPLLASVLLLVTALPAVAREFPPGKEGYHSYADLTSELADVAAAHPDIVSRFSIGQSYKGREIWAAKVSDNVAVDENEPEVLFDAGHHADEHMGTEMTLRILHWLVDGYGIDPRITAIVDTREVWIVFLMNPDGAEFDIKNGHFHYWRKNRQPTPGSSAIGTDLNRNYGYKWGGGGRTSSNPQAITFRGSGAFSSPEARAMRDFLAGRVVDGRQQIRAGISFHEYGRLVMWPYGYTKKNVPSDMTSEDRAALARIGKHMAATNGYRPEQASDLYITSGTSRDFEYGTYRIFSYTFEMSIRDYPDDSKIAKETGRNKEAVLYLMEHAWCPLGVLGDAVKSSRCGVFDDDLEVARGWVVDPDGIDTAPAGSRFTRANPEPTSSSGKKQLGRPTSGSRAFVTGAPAGVSVTSHDLDGRSTILSPQLTLANAPGQELTFRYVFAHSAGSSASDSLRAIVERSGGSQVEIFNVTGQAVDVDGTWRTAKISLDAFAGESVRLRFVAADGGDPNLLEVELDDIRVSRPE
jgi:carboxypeptidase T